MLTCLTPRTRINAWGPLIRVSLGHLKFLRYQETTGFLVGIFLCLYRKNLHWGRIIGGGIWKFKNRSESSGNNDMKSLNGMTGENK